MARKVDELQEQLKDAKLQLNKSKTSEIKWKEKAEKLEAEKYQMVEGAKHEKLNLARKLVQLLDLLKDENDLEPLLQELLDEVKQKNQTYKQMQHLLHSIELDLSE